MHIKKKKKNYAIELVLIVVAAITVPWLVFGKPFILTKKDHKTESSPSQNATITSTLLFAQMRSIWLPTDVAMAISVFIGCVMTAWLHSVSSAYFNQNSALYIKQAQVTLIMSVLLAISSMLVIWIVMMLVNKYK